jgi:hypothetical protein
MEFSAASRYATQFPGAPESLATHDLIGINSREDDCRIRKDKGAQNFAVFRHIALNLLHRERDHKRGLKARRKRAGWDRQYLMQVLNLLSATPMTPLICCYINSF